MNKYYGADYTWDKARNLFDTASEEYENQVTKENRSISRHQAHLEFLKRIGDYCGGEFLFNDESRAAK